MNKKFKILIVPNYFKESLSAIEVSEIIERAIRKALPKSETKKIPIADGGDGTVDNLVYSGYFKKVEKSVAGPLGEKVRACYGVSMDRKTALIEMAKASGLALVPKHKRNPLLTTTRGTGELILDALCRGCKKIIIGIGGSATVDAGLGMLKVLGIRFYDKKGHEVNDGGGELLKIDRIDESGKTKIAKKVEFIIAADVKNVLFGISGAAFVYGPQKGATPKMVAKLDKGLRNFAHKVKLETGVDIKNLKGGGAAGGIGTGLFAFFNARMESGADIFLKTTGIKRIIGRYDIVITGEGCIDRQTIFGKAPYRVAQFAKKHDKIVIAFCGIIKDREIVLNDRNFNAIFPIRDPSMPLETSMRNSRKLLYEHVWTVFRLINKVYN